MVTQTHDPPSPDHRARNRPPVDRLKEEPPARLLTPAQVDAIVSAMCLFVEDDLANGVTSDKRMYCDACERVRPTPGSIRYDRYELCNTCATEYEVVRIRGVVAAAGQYVRGKRFGEAEAYALAPLTPD